MRGGRSLRWLINLAALIAAALSIWSLESWRAGVDRTDFTAGTTPATLYQQPDSNGPLVVIAHGFAGSRQMMEAFSLTLSRAGYAVAAFDFEGHGRNPRAMGGDVDSIDGTTALLVAETRRVIDAAATLTGWGGQVALVGHSMASDIIVRTALADERVGPVVAVSAFSEAISAEAPRNLLLISGEWEAGLRAEGVKAIRLVDAEAEEGAIIRAGDVTRRAVAAPLTEHVSVLFSATALAETKAWLDDYYDRSSGPEVARTGGWISLLLLSIAVLWWGLAVMLPQAPASSPIPRKTFLIAMITPAVAAPLIATQIHIPFLPVLVADYLAVHLLILGGLQLAILFAAGIRPGAIKLISLLLLTIWCVAVFGYALDRYVASFVPVGDRLLVMAGVALGAVPFMLADAMLTEGGRAPFWRRMVLRLVFILSLVAAVMIDFERLLFVLIILPVIILFFAIFGLMGRWAALKSGASSAGLALGLALAWSLASTFPLFEG